MGIQYVSGERHGLQNTHVRLLDVWTGREVASFGCCVDRGNVWLVLTPDDETAALATNDIGGPLVEMYAVRSGRRVGRLRGCHEPMCFSPDGRRLAACRGEAIDVFDVRNGKRVARLRPRTWSWPKNFSPDGTLLVDSLNVWDVAAGTRRFRVKGANQICGGVFTPDGREFVVMVCTSSGCWLAYYDVTTGLERYERRVPIFTGTPARVAAGQATPDGRLLLARGLQDIDQSAEFEDWLSWVPGIRGWWPPKQGQDTIVLVEVASGREVMRRVGDFQSCAPGGRYLLAFTPQGGDELWDVPPRKPVRRFLLMAAAWSILPALLFWWRARQLRRCLPGAIV
jgi:WD40 repeat protein